MSLRVVGHDEQRRRLSQAWKAGRLAHAYLFVGPNGVGKRTFARAFAKAILCERPKIESLEACGACGSCRVFDAGAHPDFFEIGKEEDRNEFRIEVIREFLPKLSLKPAVSLERAAVIDDADRFNDEAGNALLKTLEEPPPHSRLLLIASAVEGLLPTIRSRCQTIGFSPLSSGEVAEVLMQTGESASQEEAESLAETANGSLDGIDDLRDEAWRELLPKLQDQLARLPFDLVRFAREINKFCEDAGKEAAEKRRRARAVVRTALNLFQQRFRRGEAATSGEASEDVLVELIDRTLTADEQIRRYLHLQTVIDCWMDDLAQIAAGAYSPP